jgi:transketolase
MKRFDPVRIRRAVLQMARAGDSVHVACAFSIVELLAVLYRSHLRFDPSNAVSPSRDWFVLSKGHGVMAQYACLHEIGWLTDRDLQNYFADDTRLKGLADAHVPGIEATTGSLGHGLSVAVGLALAARRLSTGQRTFVLVGDGELDEGPVWEALLSAAQWRLEGLTVLVDANGLQAMGRTDEVMNLGDIAAKLAAFGCDAVTVDGHDEAAIDAALRVLAKHRNGRPKCLVARTVKGRGVSFMENDNRWHYTRLDDDTFARALAEIERPALAPGLPRRAS